MKKNETENWNKFSFSKATVARFRWLARSSRANIDKNQGLTQTELLNYVLKNVQDHLREAKEKNSQLFLLIDTDQDGLRICSSINPLNVIV